MLALFDNREPKSRNETVAFHFILHYSGDIQHHCIVTSMASTKPSDTLLDPVAAADPSEPYGPPGCCKSAGRPRAADVEARLNNLLDTASSLFLEHGYNNVSLETIARQAHVAVRTIYVKFGGKAGLLQAIIANKHAAYFSPMANIDTDPRPMDVILREFGLRFLELVYMPAALSMHRMAVAEAITTPELAAAFNQAGPDQTRDKLRRFFARPEIAALIRDDVPAAILPFHLLNCVLGDQLSRLMTTTLVAPSKQAMEQQVQLGLALFFRSVLR